MGQDRVNTVAVRLLTVADAEACDQIILSLPHHFGHEGGRRQCAHDVRNSPGLVAIVELPALAPPRTAVLATAAAR